jgi:aminocarboxymuconate-semialdehyde decarboxylase
VPAQDKVDIHTHLLPKNLPDFKAKYGYGGFVGIEHHRPGCARMVIDGRLFREVNENLWDLQTRLNDCDRHGVRIQVLSTVPVMFCYWAKPDDALDLARLLNDQIAAAVKVHPSRFVGLGTVPLQAPELATKELERCMKTLGLAGVEIGTHVNDWNLNEPRLFPFFEAAQELGAAIFVHPWDMMGKDRMPKYWLPWLVGMPAEVSLSICSMIFGGVFERLPNLRVAFAHGGGAFPGSIGRIEHGFHVRPDLVAVDNNVNPRTYLGRFFVDSLTHDPALLTYLLDLVGENRVALGSDYPFPLGESEPGKMIESMTGLSNKTKQRLFRGTALEWLGIQELSLAIGTPLQ